MAVAIENYSGHCPPFKWCLHSPHPVCDWMLKELPSFQPHDGGADVEVTLRHQQALNITNDVTQVGTFCFNLIYGYICTRSGVPWTMSLLIIWLPCSFRCYSPRCVLQIGLLEMGKSFLRHVKSVNAN